MELQSPEENAIEELHRGSEKSTTGKQSLKFLKERKRAITFRILSFVSTGFNIYAIYKKQERGHDLWVALSLIFLITPTFFGSFYSLWCEVIEKHAKLDRTPQAKNEESSRYSPLVMHGSIQNFKDKIETLNMDDSDDEEPVQVIPKKKKKKVSMAVDVKASPKQLLKGTYVQPGIVDPKLNDEEDLVFHESPNHNMPTIPLKDFCRCLFECSWPMLISHLLLFPKEFHFFRTSWILREYFVQPFHTKAENDIQHKKIKKVSYQPLWYEFCYREIISKQISLIIAIFQSLPMTLIDLLYWSVKSENIASESSSSFFDVTNFSGGQFNILELVSFIGNLGHISYRLVSLMNQIRKFNFAKQDMNLVHMIFLTIVYFMLLSSRVVSICFIACLNWSSFIFSLSILFVQFITSNLVSWNLYLEGNKITVFISNLLMILLYVPPKCRNNRKISMLSFHAIILAEMLLMFGFGHYQLQIDPKISSNIFLVGQKVHVKSFYYGFLCSFILLAIGVFLNSKFLSTKLFKYPIMKKRNEIRKALNEVNEKYNTEYEIITGMYGQDSESFSIQKNYSPVLISTFFLVFTVQLSFIF